MSDIPSQNSLRELNHFSKNVRNAFDLYETFTALTHFSFGPRRLGDVITTALKLESQRGQVQQVVDSLADYVFTELHSMFKSLPAQHRNEVVQRLNLAYEVLQVTEKHFAHQDSYSFMQNLFQDINIMAKKGEIGRNWLPKEVQVLFGEKPEYVNAEIPLIRDIGFYEVAPPVVVTCPFLSLFHEALKKLQMDSLDNSKCWLELSQFSFQGVEPLKKNEAVELLSALMDNWHIVGNNPYLNSTVVILEKICCCTDPQCRRSVFEVAQSKLLTKGTPAFGHLIMDFQSRLSKAVNSIGSHNSIQSNPAAFEDLRTELRFLLMMSPKITSQALISHCLNKEDYIPVVVKILQGFQSVLNIAVAYYEKMTPLLVAVIDDLFRTNYERLNNLEYIDIIVKMTISMCRRKRTVIKEKGEDGKFLRAVVGDVVEESLISPGDVLGYFVLPRMFSAKDRSLPESELMTMLMLLKKIFTSFGEKDAELKYTTFVTRNLELGTVPVPHLITRLHFLLIKYQFAENDISSMSFQVLKCFGARLKDDDVVFPAETTAFILNGLKGDAWWCRYAITEWYSHSLNNPKKQIPSGLFHSLSEDLQPSFDELKVDFESAPVGCLLYSLFELALFDPSLVENILLSGLTLLPLDDGLLDQIAMALCDCCCKPFFSHRIITILPVLERMIDIFDPRSPLPFMLDQVNDNILRAMRQLKAIQIIGRAAKMAIVKVSNHDTKFACYYPEVSPDRPKNPQTVAETLLHVFCEAAKDQVTKQIQLYRGLDRKRLKGDKSVERETLLLQERLISQIVVLFHDAVFFTRFQPNEKSLRILITNLADFVMEMQGGKPKVTLDMKKLPYTTTTYVHLAPERPGSPVGEPPVDPHSPIALVPQNENNTSRGYRDPHYSHPSKRDSSGYPSNIVPAMNKGDWRGNKYPTNFSSTMRATAHQIHNDRTREQVERRFNQPSQPPPQAQPAANRYQSNGNNSPRYPNAGGDRGGVRRQPHPNQHQRFRTSGRGIHHQQQ